MNEAGVARVLSFFFPGLGHLYRGRVAKGFAWMLAFQATAALALLWLVATWDWYLKRLSMHETILDASRTLAEAGLDAGHVGPAPVWLNATDAAVLGVLLLAAGAIHIASLVCAGQPTTQVPRPASIRSVARPVLAETDSTLGSF